VENMKVIVIENEYVRGEDGMVVGYIHKIGADEEYTGCCLICRKDVFYSVNGEEVMKAIEKHLEETHGLGKDKCKWLGWHWAILW
jgi:hypothetical protein